MHDPLRAPHPPTPIIIIFFFFFFFTDVDKSRLAFAKELGATHTLQIEKGEESENVAKKISDLLGDAPDRTIECSGAQFSVHLGVNVGRPS